MTRILLMVVKLKKADGLTDSKSSVKSLEHDGFIDLSDATIEYATYVDDVK